MARHALLNNVAHRNLRVITRHGADFGDNVGSVVTFPTEYADVQREYPILFRKDAATGEMISVALLGFARDENLFLDENGWHASYIPAIVARGPFLIGFQEQRIDGELREEPVIHVDLDHPRVSETEGEPVFLPNGGHSRYIERIASALNCIRQGIEAGRNMFTAFQALGLIEPVKLQVEMSPEERINLQGYYTLHEERFAALDGASLEKLHRAGFLQAAFLVLASLHNMKKLIELRHRRRLRQGDPTGPS